MATKANPPYNQRRVKPGASRGKTGQGRRNKQVSLYPAPTPAPLDITPRCSIAASDSTGAAAFSPALTGWTNLGLGKAGTAPAVGDLVIIIGSELSISTGTWSQTAGTGTWTFHNASSAIATTPGQVTMVAWRIFDGTETTPTFTNSNGGSHRVWHAAIAIAPDVVNGIAIDAWATDLQGSTGGTSFTPNAVTAAGSGELSVILNAVCTDAELTGTIAVTPPTGWTEAITGGTSGTSGSSYADTAEISYQQNVSGTVTPGSESTSLASIANVFHVLVTTGASVNAPPLKGTANFVAPTVSGSAHVTAGALEATAHFVAPAVCPSTRPIQSNSPPPLYGATGDNTNYVFYLEFEATSNCSINGVWWWCPTGQYTNSAASESIGLWEYSGGSWSLVTSAVAPTYVPNAWNLLPFDGPVALSSGTEYAVAKSIDGATHGGGAAYSDAGSTFTAGEAFPNGITDGSVLVYSDGATGTTNKEPNGLGQQTFRIGTLDVTAGGPTGAGYEASWYGLDLDIGPSISIPASVTASALEGTAHFVAPTVSGSAHVVAGALEATAHFVSPTVKGSAAVTAGALEGTAHLVTPTVKVGSDVTAAALEGTAHLVTPTVKVGSDVTATALEATAHFVSPTVKGSAAVTAGALEGTAHFVTPTVKVGVDITAGALKGTAHFVAPTVTGAASVTAGALEGTAHFPGQSVSAAGNVDATPSALEGTATLTTPTISVGSTLSPSALEGKATLTAPTISTGATVSASALEATAHFVTPGVTGQVSVTVTPSALEATAHFGSAAAHGGVGISAAALEATAHFVAPALSTGINVVASALMGAAGFVKVVITIGGPPPIPKLAGGTVPTSHSGPGGTLVSKSGAGGTIPARSGPGGTATTHTIGGSRGATD